MKSNSIKIESNQPEFIEVALPVPLRQTFTYSVPEKFRGHIQIGARVLVSFGSRQLTGYAVEISAKPDADLDPRSIKPITDLMDEDPIINSEILELTKWASEYYSASWGELLKAALPAGINSSTERIFSATHNATDDFRLMRNSKKRELLELIIAQPGISEREIRRLFLGSTNRLVNDLIRADLIESSFEIRNSGAKPKTQKAVSLNSDADFQSAVFTKKQSILIEKLRQHAAPILLNELTKENGFGIAGIKTLAKKGFINIFPVEIRRDPLLGGTTITRENIKPNADQVRAIDVISRSTGQNFETILLHGVTGSGKTEVYIRSMRAALEHNRGALMLVPEIALTPVFLRQLRGEFGDLVAILHSSLSVGERFDEWRRIRSGEARVVIGTRSAIFAPIENLGLIVIDEEHDSSYRQSDAPFYSGRDLAIIRGKFANATVVLGSATPSLETYFNAKNGKYRLLTLPNRIGDSQLPNAEIIDLREIDKENPHDQIISPPLINEIEATLGRGEQVILLLNRRGFSQFVLCRSCGESIKCANCDITLTFHRGAKLLVCHYCDLRMPKPEVCPNCESEYLFFLGEGTERIETIIEELFPSVRIARVDRDTTTKRHQLEGILTKFEKGEIDLLVGTQMLAKGHDFPNVTLVGVISADVSLSIPDFRSAERTFQLITQVAGRAGRGARAGKVLIQTFYPDNYVIEYAKKQDYEGYYAREIQFRERLFYPPFVAITVIRINHANFDYAYSNAKILREAFRKFEESKRCIILGPAKAPIERLRGEHRLQIIVKSRSRTMLKRAINLALGQAELEGFDMQIATIEIDPASLL